MDRYIDLNRIEFVVTDTCSGRCKHCSNGERLDKSASVDAGAAVIDIKRLTIDISDCRSACGVCRKVAASMKERESL